MRRGSIHESERTGRRADAETRRQQGRSIEEPTGPRTSRSAIADATSPSGGEAKWADRAPNLLVDGVDGASEGPIDAGGTPGSVRLGAGVRESPCRNA